MIGGREAGGPGADDHDAAPGATARLRELPVVGQREVAEVALHGVDGDGRIEVAAVTRGLAGVVADAAVDGGERVVLDQLAPGRDGVARLDQPQPLLDVLAGRAARVARGQHVEVDGPAGSHRTHAPLRLAEVRQDGHIFALGGHRYPFQLRLLRTIVAARPRGEPRGRGIRMRLSDSELGAFSGSKFAASASPCLSTRPRPTSSARPAQGAGVRPRGPGFVQSKSRAACRSGGQTGGTPACRP